MVCQDCRDLACLGKVYQVSFHWVRTESIENMVVKCLKLLGLGTKVQKICGMGLEMSQEHI